MRVLQVIDSLEAGGAERVAVNIANALVDKIDGSYLCATRKGGALREGLHKNVKYLCLNKQFALDYKAFKALGEFVLNNKITIIHAHSSSFFLATLLKLFRHNNVKVIWHVHYGNIKTLSIGKLYVLKTLSKSFDYVFTVNKQLESWVNDYLKINKVCYLPNFPVQLSTKRQTQLKGEKGKRIVCLANLRHPKGHLNLVEAFSQVVAVSNGWTLHLVGKDKNDDYSINLKQLIAKLQLENKVFLYGSRQDISYILSQSTIGVLSSQSEGLPLALLEYGLAGLPVAVTNVGECGNVIGVDSINGVLVPPNNSVALAGALQKLIENKLFRLSVSKAFNKKVVNVYSEQFVLDTILEIYKKA